MDVKEFEYLIALVEQKSVTKAANQLFITQSALSKFVRSKEEEMGAQLFSRIGKRFVPTCAGEKCIEAARKILAVNKQLNEEVHRIAKNGKGRIRMAFHSSWSDFFFMIIYPLFQAIHPQVDLQIFEINSYGALDMMDRGELDLAVISAAWKAHARFFSHTLRTQRFVLAVREGDPLLEKTVNNPDYRYPYIDLAELEGIPLIMRHTTQQTRSYTMELLRSVSFKPRIALETQSRDNALRAVEYGIGVAFTLDDPTLLITHKKVRLVSFRDPNPDSYVNIIGHKEASFSAVENELIKIILDQYHLRF